MRQEPFLCNFQIRCFSPVIKGQREATWVPRRWARPRLPLSSINLEWHYIACMELIVDSLATTVARSMAQPTEALWIQSWRDTQKNTNPYRLFVKFMWNRFSFVHKRKAKSQHWRYSRRYFRAAILCNWNWVHHCPCEVQHDVYICLYLTYFFILVSSDHVLPSFVAFNYPNLETKLSRIGQKIRVKIALLTERISERRLLKMKQTIK